MIPAITYGEKARGHNTPHELPPESRFPAQHFFNVLQEVINACEEQENLISTYDIENCEHDIRSLIQLQLLVLSILIRKILIMALRKATLVEGSYNRKHASGA